jgi:hypothetical protein
LTEAVREKDRLGFLDTVRRKMALEFGAGAVFS